MGSIFDCEMALSLHPTLCNDCKNLLKHVITKVYPAALWRTIDDKYGSIKWSDAHHHGRLGLLESSGENGCQLCTLLLDQLRFCLGSPADAYRIFVKGGTEFKWQLHICFGNVSRFTKSMRLWERDQARSVIVTGDPIGDMSSTPDKLDCTITWLPSCIDDLRLPRLTGRNPTSKHSFATVASWLKDCISCHTSCVRDRNFLPKRLLDIAQLDNTWTIYLCLPHKSDRWSYATISYTWGASGYKRLKTKNHDLAHPELTEKSHLEGINFSRFPKTLQHSIRIAKNLGFRYVWIDSVCIVQDSVVDWAEQSAAMTQIYAGASLNISATSSEHSESGVLRPIQRSDLLVGRMCAATAGRQHPELESYRHQNVFVGEHPGVLDLEETHLAKRGWIFQERLVSVATVHYTDRGLIWECTQGVKLDHGQECNSSKWKEQWKSLVPSMALISTPDKGNGFIRDHTALFQRWKEWVAAYAARELYDFRDRLPAVAGIAKEISHRFNLEYTAGLWRQDIIGGLAWKRFHWLQSLKRFEGDTTPSWSWASVQGRLEYVHLIFQESIKAPNAKIVGFIEVEEQIPGSFGRTRSGRIRVAGMLQRVVVDKSIHPGVRQRDTSSVGIRTGFINPTNVEVMLDDPGRYDGNLVSCWCLRLGSVDDGGREADFFLLLEKVDGGADQFRRIGLAETEPWFYGTPEVPSSGCLASAGLQELILI